MDDDQITKRIFTRPDKATLVTCIILITSSSIFLILLGILRMMGTHPTGISWFLFFVSVVVLVISGDALRRMLRKYPKRVR